MDSPPPNSHAPHSILPIPEGGYVCACGGSECRDPQSLSKQNLMCVRIFVIYHVANFVFTFISEVLNSTQDAAASRIVELRYRVKQFGEEGSRMETLLRQKDKGMLIVIGFVCLF